MTSSEATIEVITHPNLEAPFNGMDQWMHYIGSHLERTLQLLWTKHPESNESEYFSKEELSEMIFC